MLPILTCHCAQEVFYIKAGKAIVTVNAIQQGSHCDFGAKSTCL